jgi:hypothetical protein
LSFIPFSPLEGKFSEIFFDAKNFEQFFLRKIEKYAHRTHPSSLDRFDMLECRNELVAAS